MSRELERAREVLVAELLRIGWDGLETSVRAGYPFAYVVESRDGSTWDFRYSRTMPRSARTVFVDLRDWLASR